MLERSCDICQTTVRSLISGVCVRCGSLPDPTERQRGALLEAKRERVSEGLKSAAKRSRRCKQDCPHVSLYVLVPPDTKYAGTYRRCAYLWFIEEYPPDEQIVHEMFQYPK